MIADTQNVIRQRHLERFNFAPDARSFDCRFIEAGIISYRDQGGGIELLRKETIDKCIGTAVGNPLTLGHVWVNSANRMEVENGIIHEAYFDPVDGWYHVKGVVDTEPAKAQMKIKRPSCGYRVTSFGPGGVYHGIKYDAEITGIEFNHLAIVEKPRYEEATFRLNSVSNPTNMNVFKFLKKLVTRENGADGTPVETVKTESAELGGDTTVEIEGKEVRLNDLAKAWMEQTAAAVTKKASLDDVIEIDGTDVKLNELVDTYRKARCNAAEKAKKDEEDKKRANESAPAAPPPVEAKKDPAAFDALNAARANGVSPDSGYSTNSGSLQDRLKRGKERY